MTAPDIAMLALTLAGFGLIALLPYGAFRLVELAETAAVRSRRRLVAPAMQAVRRPARAR